MRVTRPGVAADGGVGRRWTRSGGVQDRSDPTWHQHQLDPGMAYVESGRRDVKKLEREGPHTATWTGDQWWGTVRGKA